MDAKGAFWSCALLLLMGCEPSDKSSQAAREVARATKESAPSIASSAPRAPAQHETPASTASKAPAVSPLIPQSKFYGPPRLVSQFYEAQQVRKPLPEDKLKGSPLEVVCQGRTPCREIDRKNAGTGAEGVLKVLSVSLAPEGFERKYEPGSCEPIEHWVVTLSKDDQVRSAELVLELCNDGYGASGIGDDTIRVTPNHLYHAQVGGSNHRWSYSLDYQITPRRIDAWSQGGMIASNGSHFHESWDFRTFEGIAEAVELTCGPDGQAEESWTEDDVTKWVLVPVVEAPPDFVAGGWKKARLGKCAARLMSGGSGFVLHGSRDGETDSKMSLVGLRDGSFLIEIVDDTFVFEAKRVLFEDHLELWMSEGESVGGASFCMAPRREKPSQWGIRLADGTAFQGFGKPALDALETEVVRGDGYVLARVKPKQEVNFITFVYSDSDDGKRQKSLVATSSLRVGESTSLGERFFIHPEAATCELKKGRLEPVLK